MLLLRTVIPVVGRVKAFADANNINDAANLKFAIV